MRFIQTIALALGAGLVACGGGGSATAGDSGGVGPGPDGAGDVGSSGDSSGGTDGRADGSIRDGGSPSDTGVADSACSGSADGEDGGLCYSLQCPGGVHTLQDNRDRLIADLAARKCIDSCTLWAALNQAERYVFLMDTAYFGAPASRLYPPSYGNQETALDHALALYTINGPKAGQGVDFSGRGGNDYNRIYLGFDELAACVMRNFAIANPTKDPNYNQWQTSDDVAGPHAPFNQREMIYWYKPTFAFQSDGPQFHHWHQDSDFNQSGLNQRLGVCGVSDPKIVESTIAFDTFHNSDPLGDYAGQGGYGWQIVDMYVGIPSDWAYMPTGCPMTPPLNMDPYGGGTFNGMGPSLDGGACAAPPALGDAGSCIQGP